MNFEDQTLKRLGMMLVYKNSENFVNMTQFFVKTCYGHFFQYLIAF